MAGTFQGFAENPDRSRGPVAPGERQVQLEETLQVIMNNMRRIDSSIQEELARLNRKIVNLDRKISINALNLAIRERNIAAVRSSSNRTGPVNLERMYSVNTGELIGEFPYTITSLCSLDSRKIDFLKEELGLPASRWSGDEKQVLWTYIGAGKAP